MNKAKNTATYTMNLTEEALIAIAPAAKSKAALFLPHINATMQRYEITTLNRAAMWIAQVMHESGQLVYTKEIASGSAYEGRKDLGNIHPGDGVRYKGRGLIMVTGRANYEAVSKDFGIDAIAHPELLESPEYATMVAGWFWNKHGLNAYADQPASWKKVINGKVYGPFEYMTRVINGGLNGLADRKIFLARALKVLPPLFAA